MNRLTAKISLAVLYMCTPLPGPAAEEVELNISDPWVRAVPGGAKATPGYATIENTAIRANALVSVEADFPRVMIHNVKREDGVATMFHVPEVAIEAGGITKLKPGGLHIMFMGLDGTGISAGETIEAILVFRNGEEIPVRFPVRATQ